MQEDSCHSKDDGTPDERHIKRYTKSDRVLISDDFIYVGGGPESRIPDFDGVSVCHSRMGHINKFPDATVKKFVEWVRSLSDWGYCNDPLGWR